MKTVELMEKYCPGIQEEILSGKLKLSQREATVIRGTPTEALPTVVSTWREEKLNGKPDDSADTYENLELLSKVTERNFSSAATSKIQTADPLSENRPFISSGKRSTELQTIRELGEKMATVDHVADAEGMFSEINSASDSFIFRLEQCFALYPDFLTNVEIEAKVIANQRNKNNLKDNHLIKTTDAHLTFGEYQNVFLTEKEYKRLKADFAGLDGLIEQLSAYVQSTGRKYADHAATLRIWAKRQKIERKSTPGIPDYTFTEGESL